MQAHDVTFPSSLGTVVRGLRASLSAFPGVVVQPKLPDVKKRLMVTVRDDGGTPRNGLSRRRHGFNVWADDPVEAENLAIAVANACRSRFRALEVSDPIEVSDSTDDVLTVGEKTLTHYFLSAVILVRADNL